MRSPDPAVLCLVLVVLGAFVLAWAVWNVAVRMILPGY